MKLQEELDEEKQGMMSLIECYFVIKYANLLLNFAIFILYFTQIRYFPNNSLCKNHIYIF